MTPEVLQARREAYLGLLEHGLVAIRRSARAGQLQLCVAEADHIHNIPSLLDETNEHRHRYYIREERGLYLQRLEELGEVEYHKAMAPWFTWAWRVLEEIAQQAEAAPA
jgi:hypothetical protein